MDLREKLIQILLQKPNKCTFEQLADFLIANGVTVQEWIPVTERLPDNTDDVIVCHKNGYVTKNAWLVNQWWYKTKPIQLHTGCPCQNCRKENNDANNQKTMHEM